MNVVDPDTSDTIGQKAFSQALLDPRIEAPRDLGKEKEPAPKRFGVYRNNVIVSLIEALRQAYPSIHTIMGSENFDKVAGIFVRVHPPKSAMMQKFGLDFPEFLRSFKPLAKSPFLADIAKAEIAWLEAWHAPDQIPLSSEDLAAVREDAAADLRFVAHPAASLHCSEFPLFDLFNAREKWPCPGIDLTTGQNLLIVRPYLQCQAFSVDDGQAQFFTSLMAGDTLGEAIAGAIEVISDFDASAAISLALQSGAFSTFTPNASSLQT